MNKLIAFDIETAHEAGYKNWNESPGITCISASLFSAGQHTVLTAHSNYQPVMTQKDIHHFVDSLHDRYRDGYDVVAINMTGFDSRVLFLESDREHRRKIQEFTLFGYDPYWTVFCQRGYGPGLQAMADGMGVEGKLDGMNGLEAITAWQENRERQQLVLHYVEQDARATLDVFRAIRKSGGSIYWTSKRGNQMGCHAGRNVIDSLGYPKPNTSWMTNPRTRESTIGWMLEESNEFSELLTQELEKTNG